MSIDKIDKKILSQLNLNARQSFSQIGRKTKVSKQVVGYRVKTLEQKKIIQKYLTIIDTKKIGLSTHKLLIRLQDANIKQQQEILSFFETHPRVQYFALTDGTFDIVCNILSYSEIDLYQILREIDNYYGTFIADSQIITMVHTNFFFRDYLYQSKTKRRIMEFGSLKRVEIDNTEESILRCLAKDARMSIVDIAKRAKISPDSARLKIKKLEKAKVIQHYVLLPNFHLLNQTSYKVFFKLKNLTSKKESEFIEYVRKEEHIWFHSKSIGNWDAEINMDVDNPQEYRKIMFQIKDKYADIIKEYTTLQVARVVKFNFYPL